MPLVQRKKGCVIFFFLWRNNTWTIQSFVFCFPSVPRNWGNSPPFTFSTCCLDKKALHCFEKYLSLDFRAKVPCLTLVPPKILGSSSQSKVWRAMPKCDASHWKCLGHGSGVGLCRKWTESSPSSRCQVVKVSTVADVFLESSHAHN